MGLVGKQVDVTLIKPFELMATPMTKIIWKKIAELANQKFFGKYKINPKPSFFEGGDTRPVEQVSFIDIQIWLTALNELSAAGEPVLAELITGHKTGDIYRLPISAEWEFVGRGGGHYNDKYYFGSDTSDLDNYEWYKENAKGQPHPVAQKNPLILGGNEFFDMLGNIREFVDDWYPEFRPIGKDLNELYKDTLVEVRGSSYFSNQDNLDAANIVFRKSEVRDVEVGFRLVRDVRQGGSQ
jgi:formylglycine-generating enzyme required for sulfatase activity